MAVSDSHLSEYSNTGMYYTHSYLYSERNETRSFRNRILMSVYLDASCVISALYIGSTYKLQILYLKQNVLETGQNASINSWRIDEYGILSIATRMF